MANNSVNFGSTRILYSGNSRPLSHYVDKIMGYENRSFWNCKSFQSVKEAHKNMAPGEVAVVLEKDAMRFIGRDNIDDKLIHRILKSFAKDTKDKVRYINDSINIIG